MRTLLLLIPILAAPCACDRSPKSTDPAAPSASAPARDEIILAASTSTASPPPAKVHVAVTATELRLEGARVAPLPPAADREHGFEAVYKKSSRNDLMLVPLAAGMPADHGANAHVSIDARTPYRIVTEVLFTLGQSEVSTFQLLVSNGGRTTSLPDVNTPRYKSAVPAASGRDASAPPPSSSSRAKSPAPQPASSQQVADLTAQAEAMQKVMLQALVPGAKPGITVLLVADGISVKTPGGNVAPGCTDAGAGLTAPNTNGAYDFAALGRCAALVSATGTPSDEVTMVANAGVEWQSVVSAIDAVRPWFPNVLFGIARPSSSP